MKIHAITFIISLITASSSMLFTEFLNNPLSYNVYGKQQQQCIRGKCWKPGSGGNCHAVGPSTWNDCAGLVNSNSSGQQSGGCTPGPIATAQGTNPKPDDILEDKVGVQATTVGGACMIWSHGQCVYQSTPNSGSNPTTYTIRCNRSNWLQKADGNRQIGSGEGC